MTKKLYALRLREFASWGCNSCVSDEYIEKKKRSVLVDMLHLLIRFSMIIQLLKAYRIKLQKFAAHAHKGGLINETVIPT